MLSFLYHLNAHSGGQDFGSDADHNPPWLDAALRYNKDHLYRHNHKLAITDIPPIGSVLCVLCVCFVCDVYVLCVCCAACAVCCRACAVCCRACAVRVPCRVCCVYHACRVRAVSCGVCVRVVSPCLATDPCVLCSPAGGSRTR